MDAASPSIFGWGPALAQTLAALVFVCLLAVVGIRLWARLRHGAVRRGEELTRLGSLALGQGAALQLVQVRGKVLLLGVTPTAVQLLADLGAADASGPPGAEAPAAVAPEAAGSLGAGPRAGAG